MNGELVAIDLETTGFDPIQDKIIEIGAVITQDGKTIREFQTLINPNMPIPEVVSLLTGITQDDVVNAPYISEVIQQLKDFVGDRPIIGHNVGFDLSFLNTLDLFKNHTALDTYEIASVLLPKATRYNLHHLTTQIVGFTLEDAHRALDDAQASSVLYWYLWDKAKALPLPIAQEIIQAGSGLSWYGLPFFQALVNTQDLPSSLPSQTAKYESTIAGSQQVIENRLTPREALSVAEVNAYFEPDAQLATLLDGFLPNDAQRTMVEMVTDALNSDGKMLIEAGVGRTWAYLIPSMLSSVRNNERTIISVAGMESLTRLLEHDIPILQSLLADKSPKSTVLLESVHYLCLQKFALLKQRGPTSIEELRVLAKILVQQLEEPVHLRSQISLRGSSEYEAWRQISSATSTGCLKNECGGTSGIACPLYHAYQEAGHAHLILTNHAVLASMNDSHDEAMLPPSTHNLIIDEVNRLEDAVTDALTHHLDEKLLHAVIVDLVDAKRGVLTLLSTSIQQSDIPEQKQKRVLEYIIDVKNVAKETNGHVRDVFVALQRFLQEHIKNTQDNYNLARIIERDLQNSYFEAVRQKWSTLSEYILGLLDAIQTLDEVIQQLQSYNFKSYSTHRSTLESSQKTLQHCHDTLANFMQAQIVNDVRWLSWSEHFKEIVLHSAPLQVSTLLEKRIWQQYPSIVLTGSTLTTTGSFDYLKHRLNASRFKSKDVGSPFSYHDRVLILTPKDMPDIQNAKRYQATIERIIIEIATALGGKTMALFTGYAQLRQTSRGIAPRLKLGNINVLDQSDGTSASALVEGFQGNTPTVLLGARMFWEEIEIPSGDFFQALVIPKLPFPVPSDPKIASRSEQYTDSFLDFMLPEAILKFRQGFDKLIRGQNDRGVFIILDNRLTTKRYGAQFIDSLPDCKLKNTPLDKMVAEATRWLK
ncbi:MAG: exonuclease domain-containing protein [Phototrophicaceae bacterium]